LPALKLTSAELWLRLVGALLLLAVGSLLILGAVIIAAGGNFLKAGLVIFPGFVILGASVWLMITTYERLH
jgi:hypothetical protein